MVWHDVAHRKAFTIVEAFFVVGGIGDFVGCGFCVRGLRCYPPPKSPSCEGDLSLRSIFTQKEQSDWTALFCVGAIIAPFCVII